MVPVLYYLAQDIRVRPRQCKMARARLYWTVRELALKVDVIP